VTDAELQIVLAECIDAVLEQMFFVRAFEGSPSMAPQELAVQVAFSGQPSGCLTLRIAAATGRIIAAGFLGEDECVLSEQQVSEVICELANIICGSVLSRVESDASFRLTSARVIKPEEARLYAGVTHSVPAGGGALTLAFQMESPVCLTPA